MIAIQRPLQEFNFGINILKDSVAILKKITKMKLITQEMYKKMLMVEKNVKSGPVFDENNKTQNEHQ